VSPGEGVDAVVVGAVREGDELVQEGLTVSAAHELHEAVLCRRRHRLGANELLAGRALGEHALAAQQLALVALGERGAGASRLSNREKAQGHRRAAELLAERPEGAAERIARHLLATEPAGDTWVVERLVEAARAARSQGASESEAVFLRRALAEPPLTAERSGLLLDLGMAEASAGLPGWREHLQEAVDAVPNAPGAAEAAIVLAHALSRAQHYVEAVDVLDRASTALDSRHAELALRLEAAAVLPALNDPVTAPSVALRRQTLRERAADDPTGPPEVLAAAAFVSVLTNEPAETAAELATRALAAEGSASSDSGSRPWFSFAAWFSYTTFSLLLAERYAQLRPLLDASIDEARVSGDGGRLAVGLRDRGWLAFRRGELSAAEADARTALAATVLPAPPMYRVMNGTLLVKVLVDRGKLDDAEEALAPLDPEAGSGVASAWGLRFARGRLRVAQGRVAAGLEDFLRPGRDLTRVGVTCASYLPWRSEAALGQVALGDRDSAARLADEELELATAFGAPRALGVAKRAAAVVAGGERGETLLREAVDDLAHGDAKLEWAQALADLGAMIGRRNRRPEARKLLREALDVAHLAGARLLAEYAETELRATSARPRRLLLTGLDSLTASERRVAELAGSGLTNREIAQTLFVTARTVEGHLTSVFRKLQLDSREKLPAALESGADVTA
jgi:DNA-binding CsgD family transcriptional regulator